MVSVKRGLFYLKNNRAQFMDSCVKHLSFLFSDKMYLSLRYKYQMGKDIDWENPKRFTEKIQWLKIYGVKPEYSKMVDKLAVKDYVAAVIGSEYIIPTLQIWDNVSDISIDDLPQKFVLKTTHGGGSCGVVVCEDKNCFDFKKALGKLELSMRHVVGKEFKEKPYYNVPRKVFLEKYMGDNGLDLIDYKFYCFNGKPIYCQVIRDRHIKETIDFYDMEWNLMPFVGLNPRCENGVNPLEKPKCLATMIDICTKLSNNIPFARIDLYNIKNHPFFGEITFYPGGGFGSFRPDDWDEKLGELIKL